VAEDFDMFCNVSTDRRLSFPLHLVWTVAVLEAKASPFQGVHTHISSWVRCEREVVKEGYPSPMRITISQEGLSPQEFAQSVINDVKGL
jgi:hypothetical protein